MIQTREALLAALLVLLFIGSCNTPIKLVQTGSPEAPRDLKLVCVDQWITCQGGLRNCFQSSCQRDCFAEYEGCLLDPDIE